MSPEIPSATQLRTVLISGASFAGLATAWWMVRLGYAVTIVEVAQSLRKGGTPVDIREGVVEVVRQIGLLEDIASHALPPRSTVFLDMEGDPVVRRSARYDAERDGPEEYEIERDTLLDLLHERVRDKVSFLFGDSISGVDEGPNEVTVRFSSGKEGTFSLLLGCDGTHSAVRRLCFGEESSFALFMQQYFSLTVVHKLLMPENTSQLFNVPGRTVMLNAYNGKTDIAFSFHAPNEIAYSRRDQDAQKRMIADRFKEERWRVPELLEEMTRSNDFYFDRLCQIRMPSWSTRRVALVGDAAYCPSPAAGMGGSMAILGASAFGCAMERFPNDLAEAFAEYDRSLRPVVETIQANAIDYGLKMFAPRTEEEIRERNAQLENNEQQ